MHIPRHIPFCAKIKLLAFTNLNNLVAAIFLLFGLIAACMMPASSASDMLGTWRPTGKGAVLKLEPTERDDICAYRFSGMADKDQAAVAGLSYHFKGEYEPGQNVILLKSNFLGEKWKIEGAAFSSGGITADFASMFLLALTSAAMSLFLFVAVGLWYFGAFRLGWRRLRLMRSGEIAEAEFLDSEVMVFAVNNMPFHRIRFKFTAADGQKYISVVYTTAPDEVLPDHSQKLLVFYDPDSPSNNDIPSKLKGLHFDRENGTFTYSPLWLMPFLIPSLIFAAIIGILLHTMFIAAKYGSIIGPA